MSSVRMSFSVVLTALFMLLGIGICVDSADARTYNLTLTSPLAKSAAQSKGLLAWAKELEKRTNGQVKISQMTWSGSLLKATNILEGLRDGVVDVAFISNVYWPSKTPLSNALQPVFLDDFGTVASIETELFNTVPELKQEWLKWKVMPVAWFNGADQVLLSNFTWDTLEDLKGKKIRAIGRSMPLAVKRWGAIPVAISSADAYTALEKGTIDMIAGFPAYALVSNKMAEISKQVTDFRYGGWCMWFGIGMNEDVYNSLPESAKKVLAEIAPIASQFEAKANFEDAMKGFKQAKDLGQRIIQLSPEESLRLQKAMDPPTIWEGGIISAEKAGNRNVRKMMDRAVKMLNEKNAKNKRKTLVEQFLESEK